MYSSTIMATRPIEPEVLPPVKTGSDPKAHSSRAERAFGPVAVGLIMDLVDFSTFGPMGLYFGLLAGGSLTWYLCGLYDMPRRRRWPWVLAAGLYCTIPFTEFVPVATLIGACVRYWDLKRDDENSNDTPPSPGVSP